MNANEKLRSLTENSIWYFTKQQTGFKDVFLAAKIFSEIPNIHDANIETYFAENFMRYGLGTYRHRILASSQMFGLITKTPYYTRGGNYNDEITTPIFKVINRQNIGSKEFNVLMSEQLIKLKIRAVTDSEARENYNVSPLLFLFLVMWKLKKLHNIEIVDLDKIYTYVMTCKLMSEVDSAVEWIADPSSRVTDYIIKYKSDCRVRTLIFENIKLFSLVDNQVSLNHPIAEKFYDEFVSSEKCERLLMILNSNSERDYKELLGNLQNYNFDLTDNPTGTVERRRRTFRNITVDLHEKESAETREVMDEICDYFEDAESNESSEYSNEIDITNSNNRQPILRQGFETNHRYTTDPRLSKTAIKQAGYTCALTNKISGHTHNTFEPKNSRGHDYLEAHHLIPMKAQKDYVSLGINLDRLENIVALCPNCHKAVHYGTYEEKVRYLKPLYDERIGKLKRIGIDISFETLLDEYY